MGSGKAPTPPHPLEDWRSPGILKGEATLSAYLLSFAVIAQIVLGVTMVICSLLSSLRVCLERHPPLVSSFFCLLSLAVAFIGFAVYIQSHDVQNPDVKESIHFLAVVMNSASRECCLSIVAPLSLLPKTRQPPQCEIREWNMHLEESGVCYRSHYQANPALSSMLDQILSFLARQGWGEALHALCLLPRGLPHPGEPVTVPSKPSSLIGGVGEEEEVGGVLPTPSILELEPQGGQYLGSCRDLQRRRSCKEVHGSRESQDSPISSLMSLHYRSANATQPSCLPEIRSASQSALGAGQR
ncbi:hypothetical protein EYD10_14480 [Varanus komodoensis]|nr:hypothetical protein EYD10_14480 [Varanus komodoensis]